MESLTLHKNEFVREALRVWTRWVSRHAIITLMVAVGLCGVTFLYLLNNLAISTSTSGMLSPDLPFQQDNNRLSEAFPQFSNNILVVIDAQTPDIADDAAQALAARMRAEPELFGSVFDPKGSPFFRQNGLLFLDIDELDELHTELAQAQPFLATLWADPSLSSMFDMLSLALKHFSEEEGSEVFEFEKVFTDISNVVKAQREKRFHHLSWQKFMGFDEDEGPTSGWRTLLIKPALDFGSLQPASDAIDRIRSLVSELKLDHRGGVRVRLTGTAALAQQELKSVEKGMGFAGLISLTAVLVILVSGFRSAVPVFAIILTLIMGLLWTAGFAIAWVGTLNLISVAFAVLFVGLSVDFGVHFILRYAEAMRNGTAHEQSLCEAIDKLGGTLFVCATSSAIAFYSFLPTDYLGLAQLGLIAGTGMFIAFAANITLLPALLSLFPQQSWSHLSMIGGGKSRAISGLIIRHRRKTIIAGVVLGIVGLVTLPRIYFDFDPLNLKDPETESVSTLLDLTKAKGTSRYDIVILAENLEKAKTVANSVAALKEVKDTFTLFDFVPKDQQEKLDTIGDLELMLITSFAVDKTAEPISDDTRQAALKKLIESVEQFTRSNANPATISAAKSLLNEFKLLSGDASVPDGASLRDLEHRLLSELPGRLELLKESLRAGTFGLSDLPDDVRNRFVSADGQARIVVTASEDVRQRENLRRFVHAVREVAPNATDTPVVVLEAGTTVVQSFVQAMITSVSAIFLFLLFVFRNLRATILVFVPVALAALLTVAASVWFNLPFNFANVIVLPLLFGLSVDFGIHFIEREKAEMSVEAVLSTTTPLAVLMSALTTIGSFGSIALSGHPGTASMGVLLTIAICITLSCTVVFLPALMSSFPIKVPVTNP